jgi:import inner membrane translocase subunit TIM54
MGLPNMRLRLPSRNWMIFLTITGSFTGAIVYDKRERRRAQRKWCKLVEHLAEEPLDPRSMPRKLTVYLEGPPTDSLRISQEHFKEYVKPILVSSGLDWEFVQGRKEGDIRAALAGRIRKFRSPPTDDDPEADLTGKIRKNNGISEFDGPAGDIVVGRHTWKEYIRGLHEGWLGPLQEPPRPEPAQPPVTPEAPKTDDPAPADQPSDATPGTTVHSSPGQEDAPPPKAEPEKAPEVPKKPPQPLPYNSTSDYPSATLPSNIPSSFDPSIPIQEPHILGFLNTPTRLWRFLNRRYLADSIGRETAAIVLAHHRPYATVPVSSSSSNPDPPTTGEEIPEQVSALDVEEKDWHKSIRKRDEKDPKERTWLDEVVLDSRIGGRMRRAVLSEEDEVRAEGIVVSEEEIEGWIKGGVRSLWRYGKSYVVGKEKPVVYVEGEDE